jgi:hypothetical protein
VRLVLLWFGTWKNSGPNAADGIWQMRRRWNGDLTDYGLNFTSQPVLLRVRLGTYR